MTQNDKSRPTDTGGGVSRAAEGDAQARLGIRRMMKADLAALYPGMRFLERDRDGTGERPTDDPAGSATASE